MYRVYREQVWSDRAAAKPMEELVTAGLAQPGWHTVHVRSAIDMGDSWCRVTVTDTFGNSLSTLVEAAPGVGDEVRVRVALSEGWTVERLASGAFQLVTHPGAKASGPPCKTYLEAAKPAQLAGRRKARARIAEIQYTQPSANTASSVRPDADAS